MEKSETESKMETSKHTLRDANLVLQLIQGQRRMKNKTLMQARN